MSPISFVSPQREFQIVSSLLISTVNSNEFRRDLILSGYTTEKSIVELLIRTSYVKNALIVRLLRTGFDVTQDNILVDNNQKVTVIINRKDKRDLVVNGYFRTE